MEVNLVKLLHCFCLSVLLLPCLSSAFSCSGRTGFYPHPSSCYHFIACVHGQQYTMSCPGGLHYSASLKLCDWPASSGCRLPPVVTADPSPIQCSVLCPPHVGYYQFPDWSDCSRYYICMRGTITGPVKCPDGLFYDFLRWTCAYKQDVTCYNP
ncbi:peritrophin-1-like [Littorina saxatilis]|uniref:Chitin-binding type-2 domain-containing protein n=1 Tax=Littorina saxatilis TaxID=31220 RepID=A0AAN9AIF9_9CAEN